MNRFVFMVSLLCVRPKQGMLQRVLLPDTPIARTGNGIFHMICR
jgi:hypothetical protein